jgi:hypothetical protein
MTFACRTRPGDGAAGDGAARRGSAATSFTGFGAATRGGKDAIRSRDSSADRL